MIPPYMTPIPQPPCDNESCDQSATHEVRDTHNENIGRYCYHHAYRLFKLKRSDGWSPSGQGGM